MCCTIPASLTSCVVAMTWCWRLRSRAYTPGNHPSLPFALDFTIVKAPWKAYTSSPEGVRLLTRDKEVLYTSPPEGNRHVALHRHGGVHSSASAVGRALHPPVGGVPPTPPRSIPTVERERRGHPRRCLLRGFCSRHRCRSSGSGSTTCPRLACLARRSGRACPYGAPYRRTNAFLRGLHWFGPASCRTPDECWARRAGAAFSNHSCPRRAWSADRREPTGLGSTSPQGLAAEEPPLSARHCRPACRLPVS